MRHSSLFISALFICFIFNSSAQVLDGAYIKHHALSKKPFSYDNLQESKVRWSERIWRVMDLREKINHPYYFPTEESRNRKSLIQTFRFGFKSQELTAYDGMADDFTIPLSSNEAYKIGESVDTVFVEDPDGEIKPVIVENTFDYSTVLQYRIKEDWYFDTELSVMKVRIIGICPIANITDEFGEFKGVKPLYWIYFPEARPLLASQESFNKWNNSEHRTYDELLHMRKFSSYVMKKSNVYDRKISEYKSGLDALLESKKIENDISNFEQDAWTY